jgi:hypothetical protein
MDQSTSYLLQKKKGVGIVEEKIREEEKKTWQRGRDRKPRRIQEPRRLRYFY